MCQLVTMSRIRKLALVLALDADDQGNNDSSRLWVHAFNQGRQQYGAFHSLVQELAYGLMMHGSVHISDSTRVNLKPFCASLRLQ